MITLDDLDEQIVALLKRDGRMSNREVARALNVSEGTVRKRLRRLFDAHALQLKVVVSPAAVGRTVNAFLRIVADPGRASDIGEALSRHEEVAFAGLTAGRYNLVLAVAVGSRKELSQFIHDKVSLMEGVLSVDTREIIHSVKHRFDQVLIL
ncbi:MAG: Lrp/AsnC family transcriptional regulator [Sandarakinorhabdus sp.]|nr:Lrp/AsnC family transcriptional regulator [Sandarakinorhabdus sp.]